MKSNNLRNLFLVAVTLLMVCQLGWAQSAAIPPDKTVVAKALAAAQATGQAVPVVPVSAIAAAPRAMARPLVWLGSSLGLPPGPQLTAEPGFCEQQYTGYYLFCPAGLQTAYGVKQIVGGNGGAGITIAIVDADAYSYAEANLAVFNTAMGLPPCTTANGCFTSVNLSSIDGSGTGWDLESMLDLEYAHAMAPNAKLVYVQAATNGYTDMAVAVGIAASMADIVSNSWSGGENAAYDHYWNLGKVLLFSSGDYGNWPSQGYVGYPCSAPTVTCVGGTSLYVNATTHLRSSEIAWGGSGGGCSGQEGIPWWQGNNGSGVCSPYRAAPDIAAIADANTGVAVYISNPVLGTHYYRVGGTSLATPVTAGLVADIDAARVSFGKAKFTFLNPSLYAGAASNYNYFFYDVASGSNGYPAGLQFDLATGLGVSAGPAMANRFFGLTVPPPPPQ